MAQLQYKPDFDECMARVNAWYSGDIIDRVPVRFSSHNSEYEILDKGSSHATLKERWFDTEYQVAKFEKTLKNSRFLAETFPVFWPNLGPNVYPCMLGEEVVFEETTTWAKHTIDDLDSYSIDFSRENEYFKKLDEMTRYALSRCNDKYIVGYTDIHSGADAADALRGTTEIFMDMYDEPDKLLTLIQKCSNHFGEVFDYFHDLLKVANQPSVTWMNIPSESRMHIPSCDLSSMMSEEFFLKFALPFIKDELSYAEHNIFHVDGKGVARHIDALLEIPEINAYQWVQGVGVDTPIMQWVPLIKKIQSKDKGVVVDMKPQELDEFMAVVSPQGIYLCINTHDIEEQQAIIKKLLKWR